ncbi:MAG TPA: hypothetical protein PKL06_01635 [Chitinophagales bacterium]|nr:hypothetical protein [Chitinophagales bacterium]
MIKPFYIFITGILLSGIYACETDTSPKPNAWPRVHYPESDDSVVFDDPDCPYTFTLPGYYEIDRNVTYFKETPDDPCWMNLICKDLNATIYLSNKPLDEKYSYAQMIEDAYKLTYKHSSRADFIEPQEIENANGVHGLIYFVGGDAASNFQFFVTDTVHHFVRGALYFNNKPNADSLKPVIQFMVQDIEGMLGSWKWK